MCTASPRPGSTDSPGNSRRHRRACTVPECAAEKQRTLSIPETRSDRPRFYKRDFLSAKSCEFFEQSGVERSCQDHNGRWFGVVVRQHNIAGNTLLDEVRT